jgi:hypothetical protein
MGNGENGAVGSLGASGKIRKKGKRERRVDKRDEPGVILRPKGGARQGGARARNRTFRFFLDNRQIERAFYGRRRRSKTVDELAFGPIKTT